MTFTEKLELVKAGVPCESLLEKSKGGLYCCLFCGSGTHRGNKSTGAVKIYPDNGFCCYRCHEYGDSVDLIAKKYNTDIKNAVEIGYGMLGKIDHPVTTTARTTGKKKIDADFRPYYVECANRLSDQEAVAYLTSRGISYDTAHRLFIGYDPKADPAVAPGGIGDIVHPVKRIIIPTKRDHFIGRAIEPIDPKYGKLNNKDGSPGIFNERALTESDIVFVLEGAFDALSYEEIGYHAVAINSTGNVDIMLSAVKDSGTSATFVISFDNDPDEKTAKETRKAEEKLSKGLTELGIKNIILNIPGQYKDSNVALVADREQFTERVKQAVAKAKSLSLDVHEAVTPTKEKELTPAEIATSLMQNLSDVKAQGKRYIYKPYLPVGKYSILNADPGVGKTKVASAISALITTGSPLLGIKCEKPGKVLLFSIEDDAEDFLHTVTACGGDVSKVIVIKDDDDSLKLLKKHKLTYDSPIVEEMIKQVQPSLVVFDPYQKYLPKGVDMNRANELSDALSSVVRLAKQYDCHIMIIGHNTKAQTGLSYKFMGSQDFLGEARSGLSVVRDPERVKEQENLIIHVKSNNKTGKSIRYRIESIPGNEDYARIAWLGLEDYTEADYAKSQRRKLKESEGEPSPLTIDNPVVRTVLTLLKENPDGVALCYDDFVTAKDEITGSIVDIKVETEIKKISAWLDSEFGVGVACKASSLLKPYYLKGNLQTPTKNKDRRVVIQRNRNVDNQQQVFVDIAQIK